MALHRCANMMDCSHCGKTFDRGYRISAKRRAKWQFCSRECQVEAQKARAHIRLKERFEAKIDIQPDDKCWIWKGRYSANGYGSFDWKNRPHIASRMSYRIYKGDVPEHLFVCHSCDNPQCVNPGHLWLGTPKDNVDDCIQKGRARPFPLKRLGREVNTAKLDEVAVREIRKSSENLRALGRKYGVSSTAIGLIKKRVNWAWLDD
jgi:hypothetical protein